ncbi:hypothetical protein LAG90_15055 [Marinilongibacter aquaticus]|uniref:hypothetical protein n=1 Tax=Marinilongibacter aquaticus TaxID=2975157 RepID=UPI0021BD934D|nr:hypothetical protein [Marinilongibacter aquaticus]UBM58123.1 hypothetical protein LAG90_15055 [Marinilongibacter aquaticus]
MKKTLRLLSLVFLSACSHSTENEETLQENEEAFPSHFSTETDKFINAVFGDQGGTIRGFDLGDPKIKIKDMESLSLIDEADSTLAYSFESKDFELVDINYKFNAQEKLDGVQVDIYLNEEGQTNEMYTAIRKYFTLKFGPAAGNEPKETWPVNGGGSVSIKAVNHKIDHGLQINYYKAS